MRRRFPGKPRPPAAAAAAMLDAQDRVTLRIMLDQGGTVTPIGDKAVIRIPSGGARTFPLAMVDAVQATRRAAAHEAAEGRLTSDPHGG